MYRKEIKKRDWRSMRESRETPRHHSLAAGCVRAQDASLCFNSVVSLRSSSSLLGNNNILVFPPNERSGGSQMCGRGGGGGSSPLRLNWGAGRGDLQHQLLSSRRGSPQPRLSPLTPHPWPEGWDGGGSVRWLRECKQPITTYRMTFSSNSLALLEQSPTDDADSVLLSVDVHICILYTVYVCMWGWPSFLLILAFLPPWGNWKNCVSHLFRPVGRSGGEYHQSFRDLARDHRLTRRCCRGGKGGGGGGHGFEPWTMGGETEKWREGKM